jgi:hypothetical protein
MQTPRPTLIDRATARLMFPWGLMAWARGWLSPHLSPLVPSPRPSPPEGSAPVAFVFREDGWFHMTKAANSFGKRLQDFWDNTDAKQYMQALSETIHANQRELFEARAGYNGGTWAHPKLAVFFARWLDVTFAVWCDAMIDDILKGNAEVTITKPGVSSLNSLGVAGFWSGFDGRSFCLLERVDLEAREHRVGHMVPT